jgi:large subunit ribosomal protein L18
MKYWKRIAGRTRRRTYRNRNKVRGTAVRPRMSVFRSNCYIYVQVIDDETGRTLASSSSRDLARQGQLKAGSAGNRDAAKEVGLDIAARAKEAGVETVCLDRGPYKYHGRVQALADGAREGGLAF